MDLEEIFGQQKLEQRKINKALGTRLGRMTT